MEYREKLKLLTIQKGNNIVMQKNSLHCQYDTLFLLEHRRCCSITCFILDLKQTSALTL